MIPHLSREPSLLAEDLMDTRSDLQRLQDDAAATVQPGWDFVAPVDDNEVEDGEANFGYAENEEER